jgi:hypothetical protein
MEHYQILNIRGPFARIRKKYLLKKYYTELLQKQHCDTGRKSIITENEFKEYVKIFVEYDLQFKRFPKNHPNFPGMAMACTIRDYFEYSAKVHGYETYDEFVRWKYAEGPWKPSGVLYYMEMKYGN